MSDKFFFKGRQDARLDHTNHGFNPKANQKLGTKKYPLTLQVTSVESQQEVQALVDEANLVANITINNANDAVESIEELTTILSISKPITFEQLPKRNDPCHCGSGIKFKKCCA
ncbi:SEC-C metal-binding domain-containing protein [Psychrosphaera aquimarina]|uniref:SEC-C metal-binding domain-containing protein n=1 Tax=Psychrosphaera aquimarina TaxID=2044854 RepID=A0ABU3R0B9_9GAMM|nr:PBPRA1643 family SWIM/SEC-C metal-binding motif protein [Psychrosphaera aquimarina]MDU0113104.1 SEC-C metal-binding domain-containing protein [Psychrosphaera aquimarina]